MILDDYVQIKLNSKIYRHYLNLGYDLSNDDIFVKVQDLTKSSRSIVLVRCDYCLVEVKVTYKEYNRNISFNGKFACCNKCGCLKKKEISLIKYGVDSPSKLEEIKNKNEKTNLERYGNRQYMSTDDFKDKSLISKLERYGTDNLMELDFIKDRIKLTNLEKYGVENVFQSEDIKNKIKNTNLNKYGHEYYSSTDEYKEKFKKASINRYGVNHPSKSLFIMNKIKKTNSDRYGVEYYMSSEDFKVKSNKTNLEKYGNIYPNQSEELRIENSLNCKDQNYIMYVGNHRSIYNCDFGHTFSISSSTYFSRKKNDIQLCVVCNPIGSRSIKEKELYEFIQSIYGKEIIQSYRDKIEIDIYLPDLKLGFEFNGLYWHSEVQKERNYHINKTNYFKDKGIRIIHIWEDDWDLRRDIIKSQIGHLMGCSDRIFARKCEIFEINKDVAKDFLNLNHVQGWSVFDVGVGLFFNKSLIGVMCFNKLEGRKRMPDGEWCLSRYCNRLGFSVVGGASKCFSYFLKNYFPKRVISYSDNSWSDGSLYERIGFLPISDSKLDYKYIFNGERVNKSRFRKSEISRKFNFDLSDISESDFLFNVGIYKIFDCGKTKFEWISN